MKNESGVMNRLFFVCLFFVLFSNLGTRHNRMEERKETRVNAV